VVDPTIFGVPPAVLAYILSKCAYEVAQPDDIPEAERNRLFLQCVFENLVPTGLPDADKYDDK